MKKTALLMLSIVICLFFGGCGNFNVENTANDANEDIIENSNTVNHVTDSDDLDDSEDLDEHDNTQEASFTKVNLGDSITTDFVEMTVEKAETSDAIKPTDTSSVYSYKPEQDNETYFYLVGNIKNISGDSYDVEEMNIVMTFDGKYNYTGYIAADDGGNDFYGNYVKPLSSVKYYMYASVPDELIATYSKCTVKFGFHENFENTSFVTEFNECEYCYSIDLTK